MTMQSLRTLPMIAAAALSTLAVTAYAAEPKCVSQALNGHTSELCVTAVPFQHDYYTLKVDHALIFTLPDNYVEDVALTHTVPKDAAIEFALSMQSTPTVKITGGCVPVSEEQTHGGATVGIETGRRCSFKWGQVEILNNLIVSF
ncbi:hypothetical protein PP715_17630 [Ralstonia solanacearum]|uniref:Uncharacterized protein n=2 Tax=Ralstonia solanacearum TaxID=305 RepID=A0A5H2PSJ0_RALSL|nr:conserved hypothetical protein [Ralstonia solanacearum Po82]AMP68992.1 hypothetical protein UW163_05620 [Ralstonia solanacearum]AYB59362.1 hypothetical protein C2124_01500 [Ralstonia solanacearum]MCG3576709.1 hypothetical protein [Ralstonia solanacearum]MCL9841657.1 hypothetical protein [Ralstonia solanacearum]